MNGSVKQIGFAEENNPAQDHHSASEANITRYATEWHIHKYFICKYYMTSLSSKINALFKMPNLCKNSRNRKPCKIKVHMVSLGPRLAAMDSCGCILQCPPRAGVTAV